MIFNDFFLRKKIFFLVGTIRRFFQIFKIFFEKGIHVKALAGRNGKAWEKGKVPAIVMSAWMPHNHAGLNEKIGEPPIENGWRFPKFSGVKTASPLQTKGYEAIFISRQVGIRLREGGGVSVPVPEIRRFHVAVIRCSARRTRRATPRAPPRPWTGRIPAIFRRVPSARRSRRRLWRRSGSPARRVS